MIMDNCLKAHGCEHTICLDVFSFTFTATHLEQFLFTQTPRQDTDRRVAHKIKRRHSLEFWIVHLKVVKQTKSGKVMEVVYWWKRVDFKVESNKNRTVRSQFHPNSNQMCISKLQNLTWIELGARESPPEIPHLKHVSGADFIWN